MQKNTCILLTGTIKPNSSFIELNIPEQRLAEYKHAISFYLEQLKEDIIFVENSLFPLDKDPDFIRFNESGRFQLIQIPALPDVQKGKGYQEFYMLDIAIDLMTSKYSRILKITGRYIVENVAELLYCDAPLCMDFHKKMRVGITGFFIVNVDFYQKYFKGIYSKADDSKSYFIEHVLYDAVFEGNLDAQFSLFARNPKYKGISGSSGISMNRNAYKMMLRQMERKILRLLGIKQFLIEY